MSAKPITFGQFRFNPEKGTLFRDGKLVSIGRKSALILAELAKGAGEVLTKTQLIDAAWRGMAVEQSNLSVQIAALRKVLGKASSGGEWIETVPRVGYRLLSDAGAPSQATRTGPPHLSIVVLPFANIGGDPEQDYFADGVTESLTTDLSRISGSFVISRNTAFTFKRKAVDARAIGRELNVRYVLEGSVQRGSDRMRVNAQLVDAENGNHIWTERFDKPVANLFEMQDEIVARLANQLDAELTAAEARRAERTPSPDSMDLYFQGRATLNRGLSPDMLAKARGFFERSLQLDSDNIDALVGAGSVDALAGSTFATDDPVAFHSAAEVKLAKALAVAPNHALARRMMGWVLCETNRAERGVEELERSLAIDPNGALAHAFKGLAKIFIGKAEETEVHIREALRLSPRDPFVSVWLFYAGLAKAHLAEYEAAVERLGKSIDANRNNPWIHFYLAPCLVHLGRLDEARRQVKVGLAINPDLTLKLFRAGTSSRNAVYLAQRQPIYDGLRKAGMPEE